MLAGPKSMWWLVWPAIMYQKPAQLSWARVLVVQGCLYKPIRMLQNTATNLAGPLEGESKKIFVSPLHWNSFVSATRESHPYFWELCLKEKKKNRRELANLVKNSVFTIFQIWAKVEEYQETSFSSLKIPDNADHPLKIPPLPFWLSFRLPPPIPVSLSVPFSMWL